MIPVLSRLLAALLMRYQQSDDKLAALGLAIAALTTLMELKNIRFDEFYFYVLMRSPM